MGLFREDKDGKNSISDVHQTPRYTAKPREFILAIMPQRHWYTVPSNAKSMTFGKLFFDMCSKAKKANDSLFCPLVSAGTTRKFDIIFAPTPIENVPTPRILFEFMALLVGLQPAVRILPHPKQLPVYPIEVQKALGVLITRCKGHRHHHFY
jgi:hypothetical protein